MPMPHPLVATAHYPALPHLQAPLLSFQSRRPLSCTAHPCCPSYHPAGSPAELPEQAAIAFDDEAAAEAAARLEAALAAIPAVDSIELLGQVRGVQWPAGSLAWW